MVLHFFFKARTILSVSEVCRRYRLTRHELHAEPRKSDDTNEQGLWFLDGVDVGLFER